VRDFPVWGRRSFLSVRIARVNCPRCGIVIERLDWLEKYARQTLRYEKYVARLCDYLPVLDVADIEQLDKNTVYRIDRKWLARRIGDKEVEKEATGICETFTKLLNEITWDGKWYTRTICADGYRIGSDEHEEAKVFMNTQSWAVLSGVADEERAQICMDAVEQYCKTDFGYKVLSPPFTKYDPRTGMISGFTPNTRTNGGCYSHAGGYKGVADCMLGRAEEAWGTFERVAPDNPLNPVSKSAAEPFAFCNFFVPMNYMSGNSGYPWKTGTAGWFTMLMVEWILGARRHYDGLLIDPCLTKTIPHAKITRTFRGARYHITLDNSAGRCKGATSITVDGEPLEGNIIPPFTGGDHDVKVVL